MQLLAKCRNEGINLTLNQVLKSKSLARLAESISPDVMVDHGEEQTDKLFALSPVQQFYFQTIGQDQYAHFNQSLTLRLTHKVATSTLKKAFDTIVRSHSMLRARFSKDRI